MAFTDQLNVSQNTQQRFFMEYPSLHLQTQNYGKLAAPTNGDMRDDDAWDKYRFNIALQHSMHHPACFSKTQANIPLNWSNQVKIVCTVLKLCQVECFAW